MLPQVVSYTKCQLLLKYFQKCLMWIHQSTPKNPLHIISHHCIYTNAILTWHANKALAGNRTRKSIKVTIKVTILIDMYRYMYITERASLLEYACTILSLCGRVLCTSETKYMYKNLPYEHNIYFERTEFELTYHQICKSRSLRRTYRSPSPSLWSLWRLGCARDRPESWKCSNLVINN